MTPDDFAAVHGPWAAVAQAQPNIALIKYWGKRDETLNLPLVGSLSITLDTLATRTSVCFAPDTTTDDVQLNGRQDAATTRRVSACLDLLRERAGVRWGAQVRSTNNFPTAAGLASSASGFAALVVAAARALGLALSPADLSVLARCCSGSAARSIFGGFVEWTRGTRPDGQDSVAHPTLAAGAWPLRIAVAITSTTAKAIGSRAGMRHTVQTSPFVQAWLASQDSDLDAARQAIRARDFEALADVSEHSCLKMHALILASRPGLIYWNGATVEAMHCVRQLRERGIAAFFTIDAGPQLKAVCLPEALPAVTEALRAVPGVLDVIECGLGEGAHVLSGTLPERVA